LASAYIKAKQFSKGMSVRHNRNIESSPVLISEYIEDIQLHGGKKFHLRIYFMASILFGKYKTFTWNNGEVFTALNRYARGSMDPSVTDTHGSSTFGDINLFINGLPKEQYRHIIKISELLTTILGQTIKLYSETENAFEVFAIDLLIRKNNVPVLMEVNSRVGYKFNTGAVYGVPFSDDFFQWINEKVLVPAIE
jgi:predicted nucleotidyltransferase